MPLPRRAPRGGQVMTPEARKGARRLGRAAVRSGHALGEVWWPQAVSHGAERARGLFLRRDVWVCSTRTRQAEERRPPKSGTEECLHGRGRQTRDRRTRLQRAEWRATKREPSALPLAVPLAGSEAHPCATVRPWCPGTYMNMCRAVVSLCDVRRDVPTCAMRAIVDGVCRWVRSFQLYR